MAVEYALQCAIYLAYIYALNEYTIIKDQTYDMRETKFLGKVACDRRFVDVVYVPFDKSKAAIIMELKHNKSAETALSQIKEKRYFDSLANWHGNLLFVGVNYDEKSKEHSCKIERFVKD